MQAYTQLYGYTNIHGHTYSTYGRRSLIGYSSDDVSVSMYIHDNIKNNNNLHSVHDGMERPVLRYMRQLHKTFLV